MIVTGDPRLINKAHRYHPVVGMGKTVKPADAYRDAYPCFMAWVYLNQEPWSEQHIPGDNGSIVTVHMAHNAGPIPDVAVEWNWRPSEARRFITDLVADNLLSDELGAALIAGIKIRTSRREPRRHISKATRSEVLAKTSGRCVYCGVVVTLAQGKPNSYWPDHVLPVKKGGSDDVANLIPACAECNRKKLAKTLVAFAGVNS